MIFPGACKAWFLPCNTKIQPTDINAPDIEIDAWNSTLNGTQTNNVFVLKYTAGSLAWAVEADGAGTQSYEQAVRLATRSGSTKVFVTGAYAGTATFGNITLHTGGADDVFAMELK